MESQMRLQADRFSVALQLGRAFLAVMPWMTLSGTALSAQVPETRARDTVSVVPAADAPDQHLPANAEPIRWYHAAMAVGGVAALTAIDEPVQRHTQRHRSPALSDIADVFRHGGEPLFYGGVGAGILATGIVSGNHGIQRAGRRVLVSVATAGVVLESMKLLIGRSRPTEGVGAFSFHPFSSLKDSTGVAARGAMPSGHALAAFAVVTSLADDIHSTTAHLLLYTAAGGTAFSRVYENRHWVSDVAMGTVLGITIGKVVSGRWRIFNLRPPSFLVGPSGETAVRWSVPF
jgi:membrane-associated phospholipid phosphatase